MNVCGTKIVLISFIALYYKAYCLYPPPPPFLTVSSLGIGNPIDSSSVVFRGGIPGSKTLAFSQELKSPKILEGLGRNIAWYASPTAMDYALVILSFPIHPPPPPPPHQNCDPAFDL